MPSVGLVEDSAALLAEFGSRLRAARHEVGLSQEILADQAGLHRTYIGSVERGERNISLLNIVAIATELDIDPAQLVAELRWRR